MPLHRFSWLALTAALMLGSSPCWAVKPKAAELGQARDWFAARFGDGEKPPSSESPFSFKYDGKPSAEFIKTWKVHYRSGQRNNNSSERTVTYTDPATGLVLVCRAIEYRDYPTVEWVLSLKNTGTADTPLIADLQALDAGFVRPATGEFTLHSIQGDTCTPDSYRPLVETMGPGFTKRLAPGGGRPTNGQFPFWNIALPDGGFLAVVGWPGQWAARFDRDGGRGLRIRAGQELTSFKLHPGEEARSPLVVLQFYDGDWMRGQNLWRSWMVAHNIPRPGGRLVPTHYGACWSVDLHPDAATELAVMDGYIRENVKLNFWFIDAGWFPGKGNWFETTGTWQVDSQRFPHGIREVSDHARAHGMQFVLWFEPERAWAKTWITEHHPEWVLGGNNGGLVNLGNRDAWRWVVDRIDDLVTKQGVDVYRQDFNIDPLEYWRGNDAKDRQGLTENGHVTGYLAFWDELLRRHPRLWLDSCASGGRRNDLETLRRSVPLLRSDAFGDTITQQCHTYGLSLWIPYYGSGLGASDVYWFRSCIFPASRVGWDARKKDLDYPLLKRMIAEFHKVEPYLLADYYPLTPYSLEKNVWIAWQFDEPESGGGVVQAFRREGCRERSITLQLRGLDPDGSYSVEDLDTGRVDTQKGKAIVNRGLEITATNCPGSAILVYHKVR
jgi:alpha-galactosidase